MFKEFDIKNLNENIFRMIDDEWMLITAGNKEKHNMMTASWGFMGEMWGEDSVAVVVRPERYTMDFIENNDYFTLSFYGNKKDVHKVCGSISGRDADKTALAGLTPVKNEKYVYFDEARLVIVVKKKYIQPMNQECLTDKSITDKWYSKGGWHNLIIGSIERIYVKEASV